MGRWRSLPPAMKGSSDIPRFVPAMWFGFATPFPLPFSFAFLLFGCSQRVSSLNLGMVHSGRKCLGSGKQFPLRRSSPFWVKSIRNQKKKKTDGEGPQLTRIYIKYDHQQEISDWETCCVLPRRCKANQVGIRGKGGGTLLGHPSFPKIFQAMYPLCWHVAYGESSDSPAQGFLDAET